MSSRAWVDQAIADQDAQAAAERTLEVAAFLAGLNCNAKTLAQRIGTT